MKKIMTLALILILNQAIANESSKAAINCNEQKSECVYQLENKYYKYSRPSTFEFASTLPKNTWRFLDSSFSKEHLSAWGAIIASTALMIAYDQQITKETKRFGRFLKIGNGERLKPTMKIGGHYLLRLPTDVGSAMYFVGDGWVSIGLMGSFYSAGLYTKDTRTLQTGSQIFQGLLMTGLVTQILKRTTGRESPSRATSPSGKWRFFPKTSEFQRSTSKYDAFPSGHLATTMTTFMILYKNYPEYTFIKPVGITLMSLLSFEMVNNSVHWTSDYPLALGIGYMIGKTIVDNGREKMDGETSTSYFAPIVDPRGKLGIAWNLDY